MNGAGIMLMTADGPRGSLCTTNEVSALIEQLQYDLGEGPCLDAYRRDQPVLEPDLLDPSSPRWLAFAGPATEAGVRAVFGFPLQVGSVRLAIHACAAIDRGISRTSNTPTRRSSPTLPPRLCSSCRPTPRWACSPSNSNQGPTSNMSFTRHGCRPARRQRRPGTHPVEGVRLRQRPISDPGRRRGSRQDTSLRRYERRGRLGPMSRASGHRSESRAGTAVASTGIATHEQGTPDPPRQP